ncbi:FAD-dependent monooxygenase [Mycolicibacterium nivoides]|uniref:FAD-dependent monooxygenase n=1 Tax=Mycolicibacterium nivoides TaxID=2487344 RepID=A0ABW9LKT0_9MYCO
MDSCSDTPQPQAIVVGAGPTGLMLACELKMAGVDVLVIEQRQTGTVGESRAPGLQAHTLEIFDQRGLLDRFLQLGRRLPFALFATIPMSPSDHDPDWPGGLILPQHETERILASRANELGVRILWSTTLLGLHQDEQGVAVVIDDGHRWTTMRCEYLVGCDGGRSTVRSSAAIAFPGEDACSHWLVADAHLDNPPDEPFFRSPRIGTVQITRTEPGWCRLSLLLTSPPVDRAAPVTVDDVRAAMIEGIGTDFGLTTVRWASRFSDAVHQAAHYRVGRVFLAGDAAHTHSPIGGQGLNLGIQDAMNLGWKIAAAIGGGPDSLLDTYHDERHPVAAAAIALTKAQTALIKPGRQIDAVRAVMTEALATSEVCMTLSARLSGLDIQYCNDANPHPLLGRRAPNLALTTTRGDTFLFDLLHEAEFVLLNLGTTDLTPVSGQCGARLRYVQARLQHGNTSWPIPGRGAVTAPKALLIRPDGYIAWLTELEEPVDHRALTKEISRWMT